MDSNLKELLEGAGFGELDSIQLDSKDEYVAYFLYIKSAFKAFNKHLGEQLSASDTKVVERSVISYYVTRLLRSIGLMSTKYQFDDKHSVRIDTTDSSFPNHAELRQMKADYNLKDTFLDGLPSTLILKDKLIAKLREQDEEPLEILDALAKRKYYSNLYPASIYLMINKGRLLKTGKKIEGRRTYIYAWATYDMALNRPQIFVMDVQYSGKGGLDDKGNEIFVKFESIIDNIAGGSQSIYELIAFVDQEIPEIHPKLIKKYDLGPLYGSYSKDDSPYTKFHQRHKLDNKHYVFTYEEETVVAVSEMMMKAGWVGSKVPMQNFHIDKDDPECQKRKLSGLKKRLLAPHSVIQLLLADDEMKEVIQPVRNNMIAI